MALGDEGVADYARKLAAYENPHHHAHHPNKMHTAAATIAAHTNAALIRLGRRCHPGGLAGWRQGPPGALDAQGM